MKQTNASTTRYLIIGLILFPLSLLMLFRIPSFMNLLSGIMPASETTDLFGIILLFIGEAALAFGAIGAVTGKVVASAQADRLLYTTAINRTMDQQTAISAAVRNVQDQVALMNTKLQQMQASAVSAQYQKSPANCRFCGARMNDGRFCPSCGRAQS